MLARLLVDGRPMGGGTSAWACSAEHLERSLPLGIAALHGFNRAVVGFRKRLAIILGLLRIELEAAPVLAAGGNAKGRSTSSSPPRKVIVGTAMQSFWGQYPGLHNRLDQLAGIVDQMAVQAK